MERSPRIFYRGAWAHFVDGEWLYPTESGWVVFIETPPELARYADSVETEQGGANIDSPRGPTVYRQPGVSGSPLALPPPRVR